MTSVYTTDELLAEIPTIVQLMVDCKLHGSADLVEQLAATVRGLRNRAEAAERENDELHEDVLRFITQRNLVCQRAAAEVHPGPDGQDDIERKRIIQEWSEYAWDEVDGWQELAAKGAMVIAERDKLAAEVEALRAQTKKEGS